MLTAVENSKKQCIGPCCDYGVLTARSIVKILEYVDNIVSWLHKPTRLTLTCCLWEYISGSWKLLVLYKKFNIFKAIQEGSGNHCTKSSGSYFMLLDSYFGSMGPNTLGTVLGINCSAL